MKNKLIYMSVIVFIFIACLFFNQLDTEKSANRVHQHRVSQEIPDVYIQTGGNTIPGGRQWSYSENGKVVIEPYDDESKESILCDFTLADGESKTATKATIHCRGNSSRWFDKKSYSLHFVDEKGNENPKSLAGMGEHNEWVLNGPFLDKTLIRNYMCMNISGEIMDYAPNVRFCNLYLDGEYRGLYLIMESITRSAGRINLTKPSSHSKVTSYIVHLEREEDADYILDNYAYYTCRSGASALEIRYPGDNLITQKRIDYIEEDINNIEKILYSYDLKGIWGSDYTDYIDIESFAEYFIINEFFRNLDAGWYSTYFYKDARGKLKTCVWDFNNVCDNYIEYISSVNGFTMQNAPWFEALVKDKRFVNEVMTKYEKLRKDVLSEEYLINYIDETVQWLWQYTQRNYEVWDYVWEPEAQNWYEREMNFLIPVQRNPRSYEQAVEQLKNYIKERGKWLDDNIYNLYQYCHDSRNANEILH